MSEVSLQGAPERIIWWRERPVWVMLFLGFSAGVPLFLIFSSLSLWLREAGVERSTVTYFSWAVLGYSFKFVWAPLVDRLPLPFLTRALGRRRGWLLLAQLLVVLSIVLMSSVDPQVNLTTMAIAAILLGFASATQDIVIDAYRIEVAVPRLQAMLSSTYVAGYRTGMIVAGAGALYLAEWFGSSKALYSYSAWQSTYLCMAMVMGVGVVTTLLVAEPKVNKNVDNQYPTRDYVGFSLLFLVSISALIAVFWFVPQTPELLSGPSQKVFSFIWGSVTLGLALMSAYLVAVAGRKLGVINPLMVKEGYSAPIMDFFQRYGKLAIWVLLLIGFYRVSDIVMGVITNVFYQDMGYSKAQIASVTKVFGVVVTISGSFLGGLLALRFGVMRILMLGAILVAVTNLLFMWLAQVEPSIFNLTIVIIADNLSQGIAIAAFIAWLSSLTNVSFTATQYALFSSLMTLFPKLVGGYSGTLVEWMGYSNFFLFASILGLPVIALIYYVHKRLQLDQ